MRPVTAVRVFTQFPVKAKIKAKIKAKNQTAGDAFSGGFLLYYSAVIFASTASLPSI